MEVIELEIAPEMREEECSRSFSRGVSPLLLALAPTAVVLLLPMAGLVGLGRMR